MGGWCLADEGESSTDAGLEVGPKVDATDRRRAGSIHTGDLDRVLVHEGSGQLALERSDEPRDGVGHGPTESLPDPVSDPAGSGRRTTSATRFRRPAV